MFSFQKMKSSDELVFHQIPSSISFQQQQQASRYQQEAAGDLVVEVHDHHVTLMADQAINNNSVIPKASSRKRHGDQLQLSSPASNSSKPNSSNTDHNQGLEDVDQHTQRKLAHRETERQRRQDMSKLYASLRGLLPLEFVKGRRSTSDHMHQAVKYIKHMQENLRLLSVKRDQLKKFVETRSFPPPAAAAVHHHDTLINTIKTNDEEQKRLITNLVSISSSSSCNNNNINSSSSSREEIQILINSEDGFPLSGVLKAISEQGLCVITCTCTKLNGRLFHSIHSQLQLQKKTSNQANDPPTDLSVLQQRLTAAANNY